MVSPFNVSLNCFIFSSEETNCNSEFFNKVLEIFKVFGFIVVAISSCTNIISIDIRNIRLTIKILFKPDVHKTISSLSLSNFKIVIIEAIKNVKGINFVNTFDMVKNEYKR